MLSARFELAIFRVSGERINQLSHESARLTGLCMLRANGSTYINGIFMQHQASFCPLIPALVLFHHQSHWLIVADRKCTSCAHCSRQLP